MMNKIRARILSMRENAEQGSLAAVLALAAIIATVTLTLGAYSIGQIAASKTAEAQNNMNASLSDVNTYITKQLYTQGTTDIVVNQTFNYSPVDVIVTVKSVSVLPSGSTAGVTVTLEAKWRNGERSVSQTKLIPLPPESLKSASGTIIGFDANNNAIWG